MRFYNSAPRGLKTHEFIGIVQVFGPNEHVTQKNFNRKLADVLTSQILERRFDMNEIIEAAPRGKHQLLYEVPCDYGVRMGSQLEKAIRKLKQDQHTRRAIIVMARPDDEVPCCIQTIQFFIRDNELITVVSMRSWDMGLGFAYDLDTFIALGRHVAAEFRIKQGNVTVFAGSGHIYRGGNDG